MNFLKLNPSWLLYLDFTIFYMLWERLGTNRRNGRSVCCCMLFWSEMGWDRWHGWSAARAGYGLSRKDGLRWWGMHCAVRVPWRFLQFFLLGERGVSWEVWVRPSSGSVWVMLVGACRSYLMDEWGANVSCNILINKVMEVQMGQIDSEIDRLKTGWATRSKEFWSATEIPAGDQSLAVWPKGWAGFPVQCNQVNTHGWWEGAHPQKFVGSTGLGRVFGGPGGCAAPRRDLDGLEKWAERIPPREVQSPAPGEVPPKLSKDECCGQARGGDDAFQLSTGETHLEGLGGAPRKNWAGTLWQRGANSKQRGLLYSVCLEIMWKGEWMVRWWNL